MAYLIAFVAWIVLGMGLAWVMGRVCKTMAEQDRDEPLYPQRLKLVKKAQQEIAWQAKYGRTR